MNQTGIRAMPHPDGYTISIMVSTPPMYMEMNSRTTNISGVLVPGFLESAHGFCMDIVPGTAARTPVGCGGSFNGIYTASCWKLGLGTPLTSFTNLSEAQDDVRFWLMEPLSLFFLGTSPNILSLCRITRLSTVRTQKWPPLTCPRECGPRSRIYRHHSPLVIEPL